MTFSPEPSEFGGDQYESNATPLTCHPPVKHEYGDLGSFKKTLSTYHLFRRTYP